MAKKILTSKKKYKYVNKRSTLEPANANGLGGIDSRGRSNSTGLHSEDSFSLLASGAGGRVERWNPWREIKMRLIAPSIASVVLSLWGCVQRLFAARVGSGCVSPGFFLRAGGVGEKPRRCLKNGDVRVGVFRRTDFVRTGSGAHKEHLLVSGGRSPVGPQERDSAHEQNMGNLP